MYLTKEESEQIAISELTTKRNFGSRLAASYANFYIANNAIILPIFNDNNDIKAKRLLKKLFKNKTIITIYSREILLGGGNIHCITCGVPK